MNAEMNKKEEEGEGEEEVEERERGERGSCSLHIQQGVETQTSTFAGQRKREQKRGKEDSELQSTTFAENQTWTDSISKER